MVMVVSVSDGSECVLFRVLESDIMFVYVGE